MKKQPPTHLEKLKRALDEGSIDQDLYDAAITAMTSQASATDAIAQGKDRTTVGTAGVSVARNNYGDINTGVIIQQGTRPGASKGDLRRAYLARILSQADQLPLFAGDTANAQVRLSSVYTALLTQRSEREDTFGEARQAIRSTPDNPARCLSAIEVLNVDKKLVLLGGPGIGKSTFVSFVALSMAGELLGRSGPNLSTLTAPLPPEEGDHEDPKSQQWDHGALLPIHVVLRDLASQLPTSSPEVRYHPHSGGHEVAPPGGAISGEGPTGAV